MSDVNWTKSDTVWKAYPNVVSAWAFGSAQGGELRPGSDLDIGVYFVMTPSLDELAGLRGDLQSAFQVDEIDLVPLNDANPYLRFEAVCGRNLFCRDIAECAEFVSLTAREYEDEKAFLRRALRESGKEASASSDYE